MTTDVRTLTSRWWQPKVGAIGEVVTGLEDINQCILTILATPRGTDYLRPRFAMRLLDFLDKSIQEVRAPLVREIIDAISIWEPRARVLSVNVTRPDEAQLQIIVRWLPSGQESGPGATVSATTLTIPAVGLALAAGLP